MATFFISAPPLKKKEKKWCTKHPWPPFTSGKTLKTLQFYDRRSPARVSILVGELTDYRPWSLCDMVSI